MHALLRVLLEVAAAGDLWLIARERTHVAVARHVHGAVRDVAHVGLDIEEGLVVRQRLLG